MKTTVRNEIGAVNGEQAGTSERILKAAEELFIERGFDGVSINDVAVRAEVAKGLVFYYYKNKQQLFDTVLDAYYTGQAAALMGAVGARGNVRERIHAGVDAYLDFVEKHPGYPRLIQREVCSGSGNLEKVMQYMKPMQMWGENVFGGLLAREGALSPRHFFISIFGMMINYYTYMPVLEGLWEGDPMSEGALAERRAHVHAVIDGIIDRFAVSEETSGR